MITEENAHVFFRSFFKFYEIFKTVIHDKNPRFTSIFYTVLWEIVVLYAVVRNSCHPQSYW